MSLSQNIQTKTKKRNIHKNTFTQILTVLTFQKVYSWSRVALPLELARLGSTMPSAISSTVKSVKNQGAKKIIFTACHSGKLKLAFTSPNVISASPKNLFD